MQLSVIDPWSNLFDNESHNAQHCACIEKNNTWVAHQTSLSTTFMSNHLNCASTYKIFLNFEQKWKLKMICFNLWWHEDMSIFLFSFSLLYFVVLKLNCFCVWRFSFLWKFPPSWPWFHTWKAKPSKQWWRGHQQNSSSDSDRWQRQSGESRWPKGELHHPIPKRSSRALRVWHVFQVSKQKSS